MNTKTNKLPAIRKKRSRAPAVQAQLSPIEMIKQLKESGLEVADMKEMLSLQKEFEANEALKAFNLALSQLKAEDILITKDKDVAFGQTSYSHATLGNIIATAVPFLSSHGFSHRWRTAQSESGLITVTFVLTHMTGHSEETSLQASPDTSGAKNAIQAVASTVSYLERYTFLAGTGLAVIDQDDDGAGAGEPIKYITEDQQTVIADLMTEVSADEAKFLSYLNIDALEKCEAQYFDTAVRALEAKRA